MQGSVRTYLQHVLAAARVELRNDSPYFKRYYRLRDYLLFSTVVHAENNIGYSPGNREESCDNVFTMSCCTMGGKKYENNPLCANISTRPSISSGQDVRLEIRITVRSLEERQKMTIFMK